MGSEFGVQLLKKGSPAHTFNAHPTHHSPPKGEEEEGRARDKPN